MAAVELNITLQKGEDYEVVGWIDDDFGNNLDISGDTFRAQVKTACGETALASFVFAVFFDSADSRWKYRRTMAQSVINALTVNEAIWDQFQESPATKSNKMFKGKITVDCNVTEPTV